MDNMHRFISDKRRAVETPKSMVDEKGNCVFGTFDKEFEEMDLLKIKKPTGAPQCMNKLKLTLWEATEVHLKNGVLLAVVCDMGIFGKTMNIFYDKRTKKVYYWDTNLKSKDTKIAPNLLNGSIAEGVTPVSFVKYVNNFQDGKCHLSGSHKNETDQIEYDFELTRLSKPCVVSIPFDKNRPLYSQKDFFKAEGRLVINGEEMLSDNETVAVVDDHRGYYPRHAHYDWVTTLGVNETNGKKQFMAFNLTRNQSINQDDYNENLIFFEGKTSLLPPVTFTRSVESADFKDYSEWSVKDEHDMVNIKFKVYGINPMVTHAVVIKIDYFVVFGVLEGYIRDEEGNKYVLDGMMGMGEDKTLLL